MKDIKDDCPNEPDAFSKNTLPVDAATYTHIHSGELMSYDARAKRLLCSKGALSIIIRSLIDGCGGYTYMEIGDMIGKVSANTQVTEDISAEGVRRLSAEMDAVTEKLIRYDVYLNFCDNGRISTIDIEIQQESNPGYSLIKRGMYYACRSISSQLGAITGETNFDKLHKVYSIWLMVKPDSNGKAGIVTIKPSLFGDAGLLQKKYIEDVDLMEIDFVYAGDMSDIDEDKWHLFCLVNGMYIDPKNLEKLFDCELPEQNEFNKEADDVMTFEELFEARGEARGESRGIAKGIAQVALNMHLLGLNEEIISKSTGLSSEEINKLIEDNAQSSTEPYAFS